LGKENDDYDIHDFLSFSEEKAINEDVSEQNLIDVLRNDVSQQCKTTFDMTTTEYEQRLQDYFDDPSIRVEHSEETQKEVIQGSLPEDPKKYLKDTDKFTRRERYDLASEAIAKGFQAQHETRTIFSDDDRRMYYYEDGVYHENGEAKVDQYTRAALGDAHKQTISNRVADKVRADTYIDHDEFFDVDPTKISVRNGVLDLEKQELYDHSPDYHHFQKLDVEYDPQAPYEELQSFFLELVEDEETVDLLQEVFGFCLYREYFLKKAVIFHGDADNGKSTVINLLTRLLGEESISGVKLQDLSERFQKGSMVNKFANIVGDLDSHELKRTGDFKAITGGDPMKYEVKGGGHYTFRPYSKLIYSANRLPRVTSPTPAFFSRWIIIKFPYTFVEPSEFEERKDEKGVKEAERDPLVGLFEEGGLRLSGVLNFALEGLQRLLDNGEFSYANTRRENMIEWVRGSSSFQAFCMDCLKETPNSFITKEDLREAYRKYCKQHGLTHEKGAQFKAEYLRENYGVNSTRPTVGDKQKPVYEGIAFREPYNAPWKTLREEQSCFTLRETQQERSPQDLSEASEESISSSSESILGLVDANGQVRVDDAKTVFSEETIQRAISDDALMEEQGVLQVVSEELLPEEMKP